MFGWFKRGKTEARKRIEESGKRADLLAFVDELRGVMEENGGYLTACRIHKLAGHRGISGTEVVDYLLKNGWRHGLLASPLLFSDQARKDRLARAWRKLVDGEGGAE